MVQKTRSRRAKQAHERKIPSITIHSLTQEAWDARIIHTSKDRISAIHLNDYYRTYRLVSAYAAYLDRFSIATGEKVP
jgi:hypothetical protein